MSVDQDVVQKDWANVAVARAGGGARGRPRDKALVNVRDRRSIGRPVSVSACGRLIEREVAFFARSCSVLRGN